MTQEKALAILKAGHNVFLTGSAGTGKTYLLNQYIQYLKERKVNVAITASTGIAATHMNGMTIHAWSGIGVKDYLTPRHLQNLMQKKYMRDKMEHVKVLIIDEISMLHKKQLGMVDEVLRHFKQNSLPFGGIQVIFSGDFFQLPPVGERSEENKDKFCFMSPSWVGAQLKVCYLTKQYRQSENELHRILNEMRANEVSEVSVDTIREKVQEASFSDLETFPQLFTHNADVDQINIQKLAEIDGKEKKFVASTKGNKTLVETLKNNVLAQNELKLKEGAKVMFVKNNYEKGYFNGTLGEVVEFTENGFPLVRTQDKIFIEVKTETWAIEDETGKTLAAYTQLPLRLAWAITIHKSQGMTLDNACIDLRKTFEKGQGYVALSRLRDLDGLTLLGANPIALQLDELAHKADRRFQELSEEADQQYSEEELANYFDLFIKKCGGTLSKKEIKKNRDKIVTQKMGKKQTHLITKEMLDKGLSPEEIAHERGYSIVTIFGHLEKIKEIHPETDFSAIPHDPKLLEKIKLIVETLEYEKRIPLKPIYEALNQEVPYEEIKRALLFL